MVEPPDPGRHAADGHDLIRVRGARQHYLKDLSVDIPKRRPTVFTGVSGSGKSHSSSARSPLTPNG
jgi:excinuclease UvrABC ATPase subunit